jgi:hypothetical protein
VALDQSALLELPVSARDSSLEWYERPLGRSPDFLPNYTETVWQITETGSFYILADVGRAGHGELALIVDDLDSHRASLHDRQIESEEIIIIPGAGRKTLVLDPDNNIIWFIEVGG